MTEQFENDELVTAVDKYRYELNKLKSLVHEQNRIIHDIAPIIEKYNDLSKMIGDKYNEIGLLRQEAFGEIHQDMFGAFPQLNSIPQLKSPQIY